MLMTIVVHLTMDLEDCNIWITIIHVVLCMDEFLCLLFVGAHLEKRALLQDVRSEPRIIVGDMERLHTLATCSGSNLTIMK